MKDDLILEQARTIRNTLQVLKRRVSARQTQLTQLCQQEGEQAPELTIPQMNMLSAIGELEQATIKELSEHLQVSAPSVSAMVERLVEMGAISREQNPKDRREVLVRLTHKGSTLLHLAEGHILRTVVELLEEIGPELAREWADLYGRIYQLLVKSPEKPEKCAARLAR